MYIREAHAADSLWPSAIDDEEAIYQPRTLYERRAVAGKCVGKLNIDIPCLIDNMNNSVDKSYDAYPDRLFLIDVDGTIAIRAAYGPWGFKPAVSMLTRWLAERFPQIQHEEETEEPEEQEQTETS